MGNRGNKETYSGIHPGGTNRYSTVDSGTGAIFPEGTTIKPKASTCCQKARSVATCGLWSGGVVGAMTAGAVLVTLAYDPQWSKDALNFVLKLPGSDEIMPVITIIAVFAAAGLLVGLVAGVAGVIKEGCCPSQSSLPYSL